MTEINAHVVDRPNGTAAQDMAALGALLTSAGLTKLQVAGLVARIQKTAEQAAMQSVAEVVEDVRRIQEARFARIIQLIGSLTPYMGYVSKAGVLMIIQAVANETPRQ